MFLSHTSAWRVAFCFSPMIMCQWRLPANTQREDTIYVFSCARTKFARCGPSPTHYAKQTSHNPVSAWFASEAAVLWLWHASSTTCPRRWAVPCMLRICCFAPSAAAAFENTACCRAASIACCASVNSLARFVTFSSVLTLRAKLWSENGVLMAFSRYP